MKIDTDFITQLIDFGSRIQEENYGKVYAFLLKVIAEQSSDRDKEVPSVTCQHLDEVVELYNGMKELSDVQHAVMFYALEQISPGSICTQEKVNFFIEKETISFREFLERTFPNVTLEQVQQEFYRTMKKCKSNKG